MIFKGIIILLTIFSLKNGIKSEFHDNFFDFTDIKSIKNFLRNSYNISKTDYKSFDELTWDEKNATAEKVFRNTQSLIKEIAAMKSEDERREELLWDEYVLSKFKPVRSKDRDELIDLRGRLKTALKHVKFYVNKLDTSPSTYIQNNRQKNYCMHALALYEYSLEDQFRYIIKYNSTDFNDVDNIRQLFLNLTRILSMGEMEEKNRLDFCDHISSFRQEHLNFYKKIIIASFKELSVQYFAVMGQAICQPSSHYYKNFLLRWEQNLVDSLQLIIDTTKTALNAIENYVYKCRLIIRDGDSDLGRMMQAIIIAEQDLTTTKSCNHNCNLDSIKNTLNNKECDEFADCLYMSSSYEINELTNNARRYSHFRGDNDTQYGDRDRYLHLSSQKLKVSRTYNSSELEWCDYCICTCVKKRPSSSLHTATVLSFRPQLSDIDNNMAITSLRFLKKHHIIQIQIIEGQILPYGQVTNESWKLLEKFEYNKSTQKFYVVNNDNSKMPLEERIDYGHPRIMNLNDVMAPEKHVITGVRFRYAGDSLDSPKLKGGPIELQIRVTPLDFVRGKLINIDQSRWISPTEKDLKDELILENPDNPLYPPSNVKPIITSNKFVKFRVSDLKKDAGQSTVPFFSSSLLSFSKSSLLGGIGLIHRGHPGSGGHIAMKIYDFNMSPYFNTIGE